MDVMTQRAEIDAAVSGKTVCTIFAEAATKWAERPALHWKRDGEWHSLDWKGYRDEVAACHLGVPGLVLLARTVRADHGPQHSRSNVIAGLRDRFRCEVAPRLAFYKYAGAWNRWNKTPTTPRQPSLSSRTPLFSRSSCRSDSPPSGNCGNLRSSGARKPEGVPVGTSSAGRRAARLASANLFAFEASALRVRSVLEDPISLDHTGLWTTGLAQSMPHVLAVSNVVVDARVGALVACGAVLPDLGQLPASRPRRVSGSTWSGKHLQRPLSGSHVPQCRRYCRLYLLEAGVDRTGLACLVPGKS